MNRFCPIAFLLIPFISFGQFGYNKDSLVYHLSEKGYGTVFFYMPVGYQGSGTWISEGSAPVFKRDDVIKEGDSLPQLPDSIEYEEVQYGDCENFKGEFLFFKKRNKIYMLKLDYCNNYDTIELNDQSLTHLMFGFYKTISKEKFKYPKGLFFAHSSHPAIYGLSWFIKEERVEKNIYYDDLRLDDDLKNYPAVLKHNHSLKGVLLIKRLDKLISQMEAERKFVVLKKKSVVVKYKIKRPY